MCSNQTYINVARFVRMIRSCKALQCALAICILNGEKALDSFCFFLGGGFLDLEITLHSKTIASLTRGLLFCIASLINKSPLLSQTPKLT